tara:strand:- start:56 stop:1186 length:1131 start_codon:yes stop_codon:yes gene_type:complete
MIYCKICVQPNTRPNTYFTSKGICPACAYNLKSKKINWNKRLELLKGIIKKYKPKIINNYDKYDCIIGVSGGKDSTRQALFIRDKLKLNPLLVSLVHPPQTVTEIGTDNLSNLINLGFNVIVSGISPLTWQKLMRYGFLKDLNYRISTEFALFSSVPRIAINYGIKLIFWGENPGLQLGDMKSTKRRGFDGNNLRYLNTMSGGTKWFEESKIKKNKLFPYYYPDPEEFKKNKLQIIYLGWFWKDWSIFNNGIIGLAEGMKHRKDDPINTGDVFGLQSLEEDWVHVNQMIKYYKYGFGRATDYANSMIREGRISRIEGLKMVNRFDGKCSKKFISSFCNFIKISEKIFWKKIQSIVNKKLFYIKNGKIYKKFKVEYS